MAEPVKKALLALTSLILSAALLIGAYEAAAHWRYYDWRQGFTGKAWLGTVTGPSENPELMWEYRPNREHKRIRTNEHGFRDRRGIDLEKDEGEVRVAFIGDSVTLGYGEEEPTIFVRRFERSIRGLQNPGVVALNFGIDGYSTPQIAELLRARVLDFSPDFVVYTLCLNDFDFTSSAGEKVLYFRKPRSFFLVKLEHLVRRLRGVDFHTHSFRKNRQRVFDEIAEMQRLSDGADANFLLVVLPIFPVDVNSFAAYSHLEIHDALRDFAGRAGLETLDALTTFRNAGGPPRAYANDIWHPNPEGHRVIGEALAQRLAPALSAER
ncbi:MAG: SGNH/GDSL hydrolase family protein [Acidobacteriota bacterium]